MSTHIFFKIHYYNYFFRNVFPEITGGEIKRADKNILVFTLHFSLLLVNEIQ